METQELQRYEMVDSFLHSIKQAQSKAEFINKVQEFDSRFIEDHSAPSLPERQKSVEKLPPMPQEKPRNPFKSNIDESYRHQAMMQTAQQSPFNPQQSPYSGQQSVRGNYRTEQNFYKQPSGGFRPEQPQQHQQPPQQQQMPGNYGYPPESRNSHSQMNQYNGGMGGQNYNACSQKEYEDLKEQFFRQPPNMGHPGQMDQYSRMSEDNGYNMGGMGNMGGIGNMASMGGMGSMGGLPNASSSDIIPGQTSFSRPPPRNYPQRVNPFMRQ